MGAFLAGREVLPPNFTRYFTSEIPNFKSDFTKKLQRVLLVADHWFNCEGFEVSSSGCNGHCLPTRTLWVQQLKWLPKRSLVYATYPQDQVGSKQRTLLPDQRLVSDLILQAQASERECPWGSPGERTRRAEIKGVKARKAPSSRRFWYLLEESQEPSREPLRRQMAPQLMTLWDPFAWGNWMCQMRISLSWGAVETRCWIRIKYWIGCVDSVRCCLASAMWRCQRQAAGDRQEVTRKQLSLQLPWPLSGASKAPGPKSPKKSHRINVHGMAGVLLTPGSKTIENISHGHNRVNKDVFQPPLSTCYQPLRPQLRGLRNQFCPTFGGISGPKGPNDCCKKQSRSQSLVVLSSFQEEYWLHRANLYLSLAWSSSPTSQRHRANLLFLLVAASIMLPQTSHALWSRLWLVSRVKSFDEGLSLAWGHVAVVGCVNHRLARGVLA